MDQLKITLELLYDLLRTEKKREDLQKLDGTFYLDCVYYLQEKKMFLDGKDKTDDIFAAGERDKMQSEMRSIKKIFKEIYEKREKKIIDIALNKSKTGSDIIDISAMLPEEKIFYEKILITLNLQRLGILHNILKAQFPSLDMMAPKTTSLPIIIPEAPDDDDALPSELSESAATSEVTLSPPVSFSKVRFVIPTPSFVWKDLKSYGPFEAGDETEIYPEVADLLVRKGRAIKV